MRSLYRFFLAGLIIFLATIMAMAQQPSRNAPAPQVPAGKPRAPVAKSASGQASPFKPVATVRQIMLGMVEPSSNAIFDAVVYVNGEAVNIPKTDEDWAAIENNAVILAESGNLLMVGNRLKDKGEWVKWAQALVGAGAAALKAAQAKDVDALLQVGDLIDSVCEECHELYEAPQPNQQ